MLRYIPTKITSLFMAFTIMLMVFSPLAVNAQREFQSQNSPDTTETLKCGVGFGTGNPLDCVLSIAYYVFYWPASKILAVGGVFFDGMIAFSLSARVLGGDLTDNENGSLVNIGWRITRDVANAVFIFLLLYIAITTILQVNAAGTKRLLANLIVVALLLNFSLFFTKLVIDASNVAAMTFYTRMAQPKSSVPNSIVVTNPAAIGIEERTISETFISGLSPQTLVHNDTFQQIGHDSYAGRFGLMLIVFVIAGVLNLIAAFAMLLAGALFMIRVVALWIIMILAPIAFIAYIIPRASGVTKKWWSALLSQAFVAPIFLFFMYLIIVLVTSSTVQLSLSSAPGFWELIMGIVFQASVFIAFLMAAIRITTSASSSAGNFVTQWARGGQKRYISAVRGGYRTLNRHTLSRASQAVAEGENAQRLRARLPLVGGAAVSAAERGGRPYRESLDASVKKREQDLKSIKDTHQRAVTLSNMSSNRITRQSAQKAYNNMSEFEKQRLYEEARKKGDHKTMKQLDTLRQNFSHVDAERSEKLTDSFATARKKEILKIDSPQEQVKAFNTLRTDLEQRYGAGSEQAKSELENVYKAMPESTRAKLELEAEQRTARRGNGVQRYEAVAQKRKARAESFAASGNYARAERELARGKKLKERGETEQALQSGKQSLEGIRTDLESRTGETKTTDEFRKQRSKAAEKEIREAMQNIGRRLRIAPGGKPNPRDVNALKASVPKLSRDSIKNMKKADLTNEHVAPYLTPQQLDAILNRDQNKQLSTAEAEAVWKAVYNNPKKTDEQEAYLLNPLAVAEWEAARGVNTSSQNTPQNPRIIIPNTYRVRP